MKYRYFLIALSMFLCACQPAAQPPAPLGDRQALEKLSSAYENLSERLPVAPAGLTPQGKLKFIKDVFKKAGYDYTNTLHGLAQTPREAVNPYHKDMMELLFLPQRGLNRQELKTLYSQEEVASIEKITALLAQTTEDIAL